MENLPFEIDYSDPHRLQQFEYKELKFELVQIDHRFLTLFFKNRIPTERAVEFVVRNAPATKHWFTVTKEFLADEVSNKFLLQMMYDQRMDLNESHPTNAQTPDS